MFNRKEIDLINKTIELISDGDIKTFISNYQEDFKTLFNKKGGLLEENKELFNTLTTLSFLKAKDGNILISSDRMMLKNDVINNLLKARNDEFHSSITGSKPIDIYLFYSWQTDIDSKYNRSFIESCILKAIKKFNNKNPLFNLVFDKDTRNVFGSPDILDIICKKIERSSIFICDISPISCLDDKLIPNPNVMYELGFAMKSLGYERILMVGNNKHITNIANLPFDICGRRMLTYDLNEDTTIEKKALIRTQLSEVFFRHINGILSKDYDVSIIE